MPVFQKFNSFSKAIAEKKHNLGTDQLKIALTLVAPTAANSVLADLVQIDYTGCSPRNITTTSSSSAGAVYKLILAALTLTATGVAVGPFRYIVLYNDTPLEKNLIGFIDYGSALTLANTEHLDIIFDATGALIIQ